MKLSFPKVIETYVQASNEASLEAFLSCFSENARVTDEGKTISGHEAIRNWFTETRKEFDFRTEPLEVKQQDDVTVMKAKISGDFPGSPVNLDFMFVIQDGVIQVLRIY